MVSCLCGGGAEGVQGGYGYVARGDAECKGGLNGGVDNAYPIGPGALGLSVIYSMPTGRPVGGPNCPRFPTHRPTEWTLNNGAQ